MGWKNPVIVLSSRETNLFDLAYVCDPSSHLNNITGVRAANSLSENVMILLNMIVFGLSTMDHSDLVSILGIPTKKAIGAGKLPALH